jgi:hypothetical protein
MLPNTPIPLTCTEPAVIPRDPYHHNLSPISFQIDDIHHPRRLAEAFLALPVHPKAARQRQRGDPEGSVADAVSAWPFDHDLNEG